MKHCFMKLKSPQATKNKFDEIYGESAVSINTANGYFKAFSSARVQTSDKEILHTRILYTHIYYTERNITYILYTHTYHTHK